MYFKPTYRSTLHKYPKKKFYKRKYQNRFKPINSRIITVPGKTVLPRELKTCFNYVDKQTLTVTLGSASAYVYRANGMYDPNYTGTGAQPQMFDELMTFYTKFNVYGSSIKVTALSSSSTEGFDIYVAPIVDTTATYNFISATTIPGSKWQTIGPLNNSIAMIKNYANSSTITGLNPKDDTLQGTVGGDPASTWYWRIGISGTNTSGTPSFSVYCTIELKFYTLLSLPTVVAQS